MIDDFIHGFTRRRMRAFMNAARVVMNDALETWVPLEAIGDRFWFVNVNGETVHSGLIVSYVNW